MTNLSKQHRKHLADALPIYRGVKLKHQQATDGTQKLLLDWAKQPQHQGQSNHNLTVLSPSSGWETECVMIPTDSRRTACLSSQAGCPVGCRFCASGIGGLEGNLSRGQIVEQAHRLWGESSGARLTNIVFMGMGEPLANYQAVTDAIRTLNAPWGFGISARKITISTVGLPAAILKLIDFELPITLALSLHAPNDDLRRELIPWSEYTTIAELLDACHAYFSSTGREITLEYLLLGGVNDHPNQARELARLATRIRANVNLIRYNEVEGLPYERPTSDAVREFQNILRELGVNAHIRASRGRDIAAACGQLRHDHRHSSIGKSG